MSYCIINCTIQNKKAAAELAKHLVKKKLIACCSIVPSVVSIYSWDDKIQEDNEVLMIMKTETTFFKQIETEINKFHSYDIPEIICIPINNGSRKYLKWVDEQLLNKEVQ